MAKYTFEQVNPEWVNFRDFFDGDCYKSTSGDYNYTVFIIPASDRYIGFNMDLWHDLCDEAEIETDDIDGAIKYLNAKTGKRWEEMTVCGYYQGDVVTVVYCPDGNSYETAQICGELWLGCGKEYSFTDEDGDTVYGYYVADCQAYRDEDIKKILCEYEGVNPAETDLILVDGYHTVTDYRTV